MGVFTGFNIAGGDLLSAGSGLIGGIFNAIGQRKANQTAIDINKMNNEFNERMLDKQLAFQTDMWNKTNEYNDPSAARARLEAAGFNPYLAIGNTGSAGTASAMSGGSAQSAGNAQIRPVQFDTASAVSAFQNMANNQALHSVRSSEARKNDAEAENTEIRNLTESSIRLAELENYYARTGQIKAATRYQLMNNEVYNAQMAELKKQAGLNNMKIQSEIDNLKMDYIIKDLQGRLLGKQYDWFDINAQQEYAYKLSQIKNIDADTKLKLAQELKTYAEKKGIQISNRIAEETADNLIAARNAANYNSLMYDVTYGGKVRATHDMQHKIWQNKIDSWQIPLIQSKIGVNESEEFRNYFAPTVEGLLGLGGFGAYDTWRRTGSENIEDFFESVDRGKKGSYTRSGRRRRYSLSPRRK